MGLTDEKEHPLDRSERGEVFMVFPYMDHDLCGLLANPAFLIKPTVVKTLMKQLLAGLVYIHGVRLAVIPYAPG
jgi:serine/threonine-protein kinase BUR1